jgi:DNA (cytosine-5)-methyltransferase 1
VQFGSLFSGIGGLDLGLERAGMKCVWQVESDEYCRRVLKKHWPAVRRHGAIETFPPSDSDAACHREKQVPTSRQKEERQDGTYSTWHCELIAGGFPCQPVSLAGRRQAQRDPRWLWPHFARVVRILRPRFVLVENTPGLLSMGGLDVLGDLAEMGFDAEWSTLPASAFGAPHERERLFIVAYTMQLRRQRRRSRSGRRAEHPNVAEKCSAFWNEETSASNSDDNSDTHQARIFRPGREIASLPYPCWGSDKPGVDRTSYGIPRRVDRIKGLGNAVVPQVAEWIGRRILAAATS